MNNKRIRQVNLKAFALRFGTSLFLVALLFFSSDLPVVSAHCLPLGDVDCSGQVDVADFFYLVSNYNSGDAGADLDDNGQVNALDISLLLANFGQVLPTTPPPSDSFFSFEDKKLTVKTAMLELKVEGGVIVYIKDLTSGEVLVDTDPWLNRPNLSQSFMPITSSLVSFEEIGASKGKLAYQIGTNQLVLNFEVDPAGEVIVQLVGVGSGIPELIDLAIVNFSKAAVILGSGAKYLRNEPSLTDRCSHWGVDSPIMAVADGDSSVLAVWSETTSFPDQNIILQHQPDYDHLIMQTKKDLKETDDQKIVSSPWRLGTYPNWILAARRWRERLEQRTGAKPLWENKTPWVRKIHAMYWFTNNYFGTNESEYANLADQVPPEELLLLLWNGDRIVMFGDHTLAEQIGMPTPAANEIINRYGWKVLLYHPWTLIKSAYGENLRLGELSGKGYLPAGYTFQPDYDGTTQNWYNHWLGVETGYFPDPGEEIDTYVLHAGSDKFINYFVRNLANYCDAHDADGAYLDVMGMDHDFLFPASKKVVDGRDYIYGELVSASRFMQARPDLALMSEYQPQWLIPDVFYTWAGSETFEAFHKSKRLNHPLKVALTGSYFWTRESNEKNINDAVSALLGGLPELSLV
ncbi:hypothetical protein ACFLZP_03635, partial [Patescibacteria group bacterium]